MRIGIDIDDTLTDIKDKLTAAAFKYAESINKGIKDKKIEIKDIYNNGNIYQKIFNFTYEELKYFLGPVQEEITNNAIPRPYCVDVINKLHNEGNEIYIITARDCEFHKDPYSQSETWLKENNIYFDKLIVNARDKKRICIENNIDLFIDDSINNCLSVSSVGITSLTINNNKYNDINIENFENWLQIYDYICNTPIIKIIDFNDKYINEVHDFINESMHKFINRPYKQRIDVLNIEDYYLKNGGKFWLAMDVKNDKIVGTIALENRNNDYAILKRFYVDEKYQNIGIGKKLYEKFEKYIKEYTNIKKIYLVCGRVLNKAHKFYINNGFKQVNSLDIDIHYAEDDDMFIKIIE